MLLLSGELTDQVWMGAGYGVVLSSRGELGFGCCRCITEGKVLIKQYQGPGLYLLGHLGWQLVLPRLCLMRLSPNWMATSASYVYVYGQVSRLVRPPIYLHLGYCGGVFPAPNVWKPWISCEILYWSPGCVREEYLVTLYSIHMRPLCTQVHISDHTTPAPVGYCKRNTIPQHIKIHWLSCENKSLPGLDARRRTTLVIRGHSVLPNVRYVSMAQWWELYSG